MRYSYDFHPTREPSTYFFFIPSQNIQTVSFSPSNILMEHITTASLEHLSTRISYLCAFLSITSADAAILRSAQPLITPLIPSLLNAVYTKLLSFDITAKIFVPKDMDDDGRMTMAHPQIVLRKDFLRVGCLFLNCFSSQCSST
jgi:hypothetical protein